MIRGRFPCIARGSCPPRAWLSSQSRSSVLSVHSPSGSRRHGRDARHVETSSVTPFRAHATSAAAWTTPTTGLISILPRALVPFAELSRLEKPAGSAYLFAPCVFATLMAGAAAVPHPDVSSVLGTGLLFLGGAVVMRGAGCTLNDLYDRNLDRLVERTRSRPLARRAVGVPAALAWATAQCLVGLGVLTQFSTNTILMGIPSMLLVMTYPLAKRVTHYPQLVLGCGFSWGAVLGFPAMGVDLVDFGLVLPPASQMSLESLSAAYGNMSVTLGDPNAIAAAALLYASCVAWTLNYDTIYAFQDVRDDVRAGIKSTAQAFSSKGVATDLVDTRPKAVLAALSVAQTALLAASGYMLGLSPLFYALSCGGCAATLGIMVRRVRLQDVSSCARWFRRSCWLTGGAVSFGLAVEYLAAREKEAKKVASPSV